MDNQQNRDSTTGLPKTLIERLFYFAQTTPSQGAVVTHDMTLSYAQLALVVQKQAYQLRLQGIEANTVVGIQCADDVGHLILTLAACYLGARSCTVPTYDELQVQEGIISRCGVTIVLDASAVIDLHQRQNLPTIEIERALQSSIVFATSGSTGQPKLVLYYDADLVAQAHRHISGSHERFTCRAAMEHNFAKRHRLFCLAMGASNLFLRTQQESLIEDCLKLNVNVMHVSSFQAQELLHHPERGQLASIRLKLGGSHIPLALREQLRTNITSQLQAGYGTTETGAIAFTDPEDLEAGESVGKALPGVTVRVVDADRNPLPLGQKGELAIHGEGLFRGYLGQAELTDKRLDKGWFYTGDIGYLDAQHRIHLSGRIDDMFTFNSINIYPQEIEAEIRQYPDVVDTVVLPKDSSVHGQIPVALVVFNKDAKPKVTALEAFMQKRVGLRSPKHYTIVDAIPTNTAGKVSRVAAAKLTEQSDVLRRQIVDLIEDKYKAQIKAAHITEFIAGKRDISLNKFNMDSLARMSLLVSLEIHYDIIISPQELARLRTLGKLAARALMLSKSKAETNVSLKHYFDVSMNDMDDKPYIVRFFQRLYRYCPTVTLLNQTFAKLEHRLCPQDISCLAQYHEKKALLPADAESKFYQAVTVWLNETQTLMLNSGRRHLNSFSAQKVGVGMILFSSSDKTAEKTLLIVFPPRGIRHLMMPNAVLLQHIDEQQYDLLMMPDREYRFGAGALIRTTQWLQQQTWYQSYANVRTLGLSAGSFPAMMMGSLLQAEMMLSIAGRFHKKKHFIVNADKVITSWRLRKQAYRHKLILSYSINNKRDSRFARFFNKMYHGKEVAISVQDETLPHLMLRRLAERSELTPYLDNTLFAQPDEVSLANYQQRRIMHFPLT